MEEDENILIFLSASGRRIMTALTGKQRAHDKDVSKGPQPADLSFWSQEEHPRLLSEETIYLYFAASFSLLQSFLDSFLFTKKTMATGEPFLAAFLGVQFDRLSSPELLSFARQERVVKKLNTCSKTLSRIGAVLDDAGEKQHDWAVKGWLDDLIDLVYDVDDVLDEMATEALRFRLMEENQVSKSKVRVFIPTCCIGFTPSAVKFNRRLGFGIESITARFNEMVKQKDDLKLSENDDRRSYRKRERGLPTVSVETEHYIYGRDKDKDVILEFLLAEKHGDAQLSIIPIVGMGGIGKTTIAQLLFNDEKVQSFFDLKAWAWVSEDFNVVRITKTILKLVSSESCDDNDVNSSESCDGNDVNLLQVKLKEKLKGKKFLIVLDDLWNENYHDWALLCAPFEFGAMGSTIIITTRNQGVSSTTGTVPAYHLQGLSNDYCLSILAHHALRTSNFDAHPNLKDIGEGIIRKCKGSPLAAKVLGGVLRNHVDRDEWELILKSKIWDLPVVENEIASALMLSYYHLPSDLKRCFAYCSIFPKDYIFEEKQLVLLWMAEGLIKPQEDTKQMEDLGRQYFRELLSRSFFQQSSSDESQFLMHDLVNDLAQRIAGGICFIMEDRIGGSNSKIFIKARHSSYLGDKYDSIEKFEAFSKLTCLRTFLPLMLPRLGGCYLTPNVPRLLLPKLRCLRVLSLSGYCIVELPDSIGNLKHLRYLDLSYTRIRGLPESTTTLYNLQTLILKNCHYLKELPSKLGNLVNLRHLDILNANKLEGMPPQINKLTCLQTLSNLVVGKGNCFALKELGSLLHLRGTLIISRLENAIEPRDARDAKLIRKPDLTGLCLEWGVNVDGSQDRTSELEVLNMLQPNEALKELTIKCYGGTKFPTWIRCPLFPNMVLLRIENCKGCKLLPAVGQLPLLKDLFIKGMVGVKNVGCEFYEEGCSQPFRSLETLCFEDMEEWESWIPNAEFPHLRELSIKNCPKLLGMLPNHLPLLETVLVEECQNLLVSISSFPVLCDLQIEGSKGVVCESNVDFSLLNSKSLSTILEFTCPTEGFIFYVKDLAIGNYEDLTPLWSNDVGLLQHFPYLCVLRIDNCPNLGFLFAKEEKEHPQLGLPSTLREIHISCNGMESLPKAMMYNNTCLENIHIYRCDSLKHFAIGQLPPTLKRLEIRYCENMLILVDEDDINNCSRSTSLLEYLEIRDCPSLKFLTRSGELPATLKHLWIYNCRELLTIAKSFHYNSSLEQINICSCENLKSLPMGIHTLSLLNRIGIEGCPTLVSFPDGGLLPGNLKELTINACEKMQALPNCGYNITSLQELSIRKCPGMVSFPEEGFPTNLKSLEISDCNIIEALLELGFHKLISLQHLEISGGCMHLVSFPEMMLPTSLTSLHIRNFPNLKYLSSKGFRYLSSLKTLRIDSCEKLMFFPEDGLPPSLLELCISNCPLLKECCKKDQGREWFKIAHIPYVAIDRRFIYDPEEENQ